MAARQSCVPGLELWLGDPARPVPCPAEEAREPESEKESTCQGPVSPGERCRGGGVWGCSTVHRKPWRPQWRPPPAHMALGPWNGLALTCGPGCPRFGGCRPLGSLGIWALGPEVEVVEIRNKKELETVAWLPSLQGCREECSQGLVVAAFTTLLWARPGTRAAHTPAHRRPPT